MVTKFQIVTIHVLKNELGMSEEEYRTALASYGVNSSKDLSKEQANDLIEKLRRLTGRDAGQPLKYDELGIRYDSFRKEYFATPKQLRLIEALWRSNKNVVDKSDKALLKYVKRITGVDRMEWLMMSDVKKVVKAIKEIRQLSKERANGKS